LIDFILEYLAAIGMPDRATWRIWIAIVGTAVAVIIFVVAFL